MCEPCGQGPEHVHLRGGEGKGADGGRGAKKGDREPPETRMERSVLFTMNKYFLHLGSHEILLNLNF